MHALPTALEKTASRSLRIQWSDGKTLEYPFARLRAACPCASCKERKRAETSRPKTSLPVMKSEEAVEVEVLEMRPVGNYAYNITFSDGHSSGLFTMELLRELGIPGSESTPSSP